jgi:multidrug efflux pump subunit AcrB
LESLNLVLVVGLSVDYCVHLAEGYSRSVHKKRTGRVYDALEEVGISVLSGCCTTLGASSFLIFAQILFFTQFGAFMFATIGLSIFYSLGMFITLLGIIGPQNDIGSLWYFVRKFKAWREKKKVNSESSRLDEQPGKSLDDKPGIKLDEKPTDNDK